MSKHSEYTYDIVVIGSGAAGMIAAITAAKRGKRVVLLEKLSSIGVKLKATGGGRCNLSNTLEKEVFMSRFGRDGKFMMPALERFDRKDLIDFFDEIGVKTHIPDGFRIFPVTHKATTVVHAMSDALQRYGVEIRCRRQAVGLNISDGSICVSTENGEHYAASRVIIATGGRGYPALGAEGDGYRLARLVGHSVTPLYPAMMPLKTKERWVAQCRADTLAKVTLRVDMKKYRKLQATGDLIFTKEGIRGPVVLDFSREITPLLDRYKEVPLLANFTKGMHETEIIEHIKKVASQPEISDTLSIMRTLLPESVSMVLCRMAEIDPLQSWGKQNGKSRDRLVKLLAWTPLTVNGHDGFDYAMITRGGISLKEIDPYTMQSRLCRGLYFCGEVMNIDGPCGGYNLQWSFSSGYLAGFSASE